MPTTTVHVSYGLPRKGLPAAASVRRWVEAALAGQRRHIELAVRYVDSDEGRALNRDYRGKDYATNVLSFVYETEPLTVGDLVICASVVAEEAVAQRKSVEAHHAHLVVHGVLHLQGYEHETSAADAEIMEEKEREILAGLGYPDPYR